MTKTDALIKYYIDSVIRTGTLNQSYIFEGADNPEKTEMATYLAKAVLCTAADTEKPCGSCHACHLIDNGNHPDLKTVSHEKPTVISVEEVRQQIVQDIGIRPYYGGRKVYIIPEAELLNVNGQNALLKTIEEPPEYALIILLVSDKELMLPTVRSRCVTLSFRSEPDYYPDDEGIRELYIRIENLISGQSTEGTEDMIHFAKELSSSDKDQLPGLFTHIERICRDALFYKSGIELTAVPAAGYIEKTAKIPYDGLEHILTATKQARHDVRRNIAVETVLESLLLHIAQIRKRTDIQKGNI